MPAVNISNVAELTKLSDGELSALIHERVMGGDKVEPGRCAFCGWPFAAEFKSGRTPESCSMRPTPSPIVPPYASSLDACRVAELKVCELNGRRYAVKLSISGVEGTYIFMASARERCIAMLLATGAK